MDFNQWLYNGVPYVNAYGEQNLRQRFLKEKTSSPSKNSKELEIPNYLQEYISQAITKVEAWNNSDCVEPCVMTGTNPHIRKLLYQKLGELFPELDLSSQVDEASNQTSFIAKKLTEEEKAAQRAELEQKFKEKMGFRSIYNALVEA